MDSEAEAKYAKILVQLHKVLGVEVPEDLPDQFILLPLVMHLVSKINEQHQAIILISQSLNRAVKEIAPTITGLNKRVQELEQKQQKQGE